MKKMTNHVLGLIIIAGIIGNTASYGAPRNGNKNKNESAKVVEETGSMGGQPIKTYKEVPSGTEETGSMGGQPIKTYKNIPS